MAKKPNPSNPRSVSSTPKSGTAATTNPVNTQGTIATSSPTSRPASSTISQGANTLNPRSSPQEIVEYVWKKYLNETPSRTLLLDAFMAFLVIVGVIQFLYCILAGNYPFNAFLSGFSAAVGQFVLTASLRMQTSERPPPAATSATAKKTKTIDGVTGEVIEEGAEGLSKYSSERAFADFVFGSLILHGFCVNFIN